MSADNNVGWRCPVCGRGVAPTAVICEHGQPSSKTIGAAIKILAAQVPTHEMDLETGRMKKPHRKPKGSGQLPKGTVKRWALQQVGSITAEKAAIGAGTSIGAASQGLRQLAIAGFLEKLERGRWVVTAKGKKEAAGIPTGAWRR